MEEKICIPDIGDFNDVEVIEVLIKVGDNVAVEHSLITLESDKATMDVPSPVAGVVTEVMIAAGDKVSQGAHIVSVRTVEGDTVAQTPQPTEIVAVSEVAAKAQAAATEEFQDVIVPDIGDFEAVEIIEVLVNVGDSVAVEHSLITLESDKATMDVPSPVAGRIVELCVSVGDKVSQGDVIARMSAAVVETPVAASFATEKPPAALPPPEKSPKIAAALPPPLPRIVEGEYAKPHAGPAVRRFARELGVELSAVRGSGRRGRILKEDVQQYVKTALATPKGGGGLDDLLAMEEIDFRQFGEVETHPLSRINKLSAANLRRNWLVAPHVTQFMDADITDMEEFRQSLQSEAKRGGYKMTPLVFLLKAAVAALREFPRFNASLQPDGNNLILKRYYNIGVAVDTPNGLVVPVVRDVERKGLADLAKELAEISARARAGRLKREELKGGCFTISSLGGIGGSYFTPIINLPEVAILGVARAETKPSWDGETFVPRLHLPLALSYDHRVIDGAEGARFITFYAGLLGDIRRLAL